MITRIKSVRTLLLPLAFGVGWSLGACTLPNPDHCQNIAIDPNAWCAQAHPDQPYCSPCEADNNGCVADEPSQADCPTYTVPASETGTSDTDTGTSDTDTGTGTSDTGTSDTDTETG